jgi:hypothetical protein
VQASVRYQLRGASVLDLRMLRGMRHDLSECAGVIRSWGLRARFLHARCMA